MSAADDLQQYRNLGDNWDGQGASAPLPESIDHALAFLASAEDADTWDASLHADGRAILDRDGEEILFGGDGVAYRYKATLK